MKSIHGRTLLVLMLLLTLSLPAATAPPVGVVLGGGAARGFSHIGLIQALEENGIPIDLLVGTSMGSIVSSLYAAGYSVDNMRHIVTTLDTAQFIDLSIPPKGGLMNTSRLQCYLDALLDHKQFSQLNIPFYSVITNIRTGEEVALNEGLVSTGVLASMSIPALFPPVLIEDQYFVDGGMKNAVPANVAKDQGADVIIAVDVKKELEHIDHDDVLTNFQLSMWFMIDGYVQVNTAMADVVIVPETKYDSYMDYQKVELFIEQGYQAGLAQMDQIKAAILAQDPGFQFTPYSQEGFSVEELSKITTEAAAKVANLPRPLSVMPELTLEPLGEFPQIGLKIAHGPLGSFSLGYRYGFHPSRGGHEAYLGWARANLGRIRAFIRPPQELDRPTWGTQLELPLTEKTLLSAVYLSQGPTKWQIAGTHRDLIQLAHVSTDLGAKLTQKRTPLAGKPLVVTIHSTLKLYPFAEPRSALEISLVKPYVYGSIALDTPLDSFNAHLSSEVGVGSELTLFGLYPVEVRVGYRNKGTSNTTWAFMIKGGSF